MDNVPCPPVEPSGALRVTGGRRATICVNVRTPARIALGRGVAEPPQSHMPPNLRIAASCKPHC